LQELLLKAGFTAIEQKEILVSNFIPSELLKVQEESSLEGSLALVAEAQKK